MVIFRCGVVTVAPCRRPDATGNSRACTPQRQLREKPPRRGHAQFNRTDAVVQKDARKTGSAGRILELFRGNQSRLLERAAVAARARLTCRKFSRCPQPSLPTAWTRRSRAAKWRDL